MRCQLKKYNLIRSSLGIIPTRRNNFLAHPVASTLSSHDPNGHFVAGNFTVTLNTLRQFPRYIAVEGPIGVGKTSLTKRFAETFNYQTLLETPEVNPFLERFYQNRKQAALQTQLFFLFERARQLQELKQADMFEPVRVADFIIEKDRLFAEINLDRDELALYENVYRHLINDVPTPDLVIYLQAPAEVLMERVLQRGIKHERNMDKHYIQQLVEAYTKFFHYYDASPLLIVNATEVDLVNNDEDYDALINFLPRITRGRHYYNPAPSML